MASDEVEERSGEAVHDPFLALPGGLWGPGVSHRVEEARHSHREVGREALVEVKLPVVGTLRLA